MLVHLIQIKHPLLLFLQFPIEHIVNSVICWLLFRVVLFLRASCCWGVSWAHDIGDEHWLGGLGWLRHLFFYFTQGWGGAPDFQIGLVTCILAKARRVRHRTFGTVLEWNFEILVAWAGGRTVGASIFIVLNEYVINNQCSLLAKGRLARGREDLLIVWWIVIRNLIFADDYFLPILRGLIHNLWTARRFV
jgi:hypothetical protein